MVIYNKDRKRYQINNNKEFIYDVFEFERLIKHADQEENLSIKSTLYENATTIYHHPFGKDIDEIWAESYRRKYYQLYEKAMLFLLK